MKTWAETRELLIAAGIPAEQLPVEWEPGINLRGAPLSLADLREADLRGANLRWADLRGADLSGAAHDRWTTWPTGFTPTEQAP